MVLLCLGMKECSQCYTTARQVKAVSTVAGSQCCRDGGMWPPGHARAQDARYPYETRPQVIRQDGDGATLRRIMWHCGVVHQTVSNGVAVHANALPHRPPQHAAFDDRYPYVGHKKRGQCRDGGRPPHTPHRERSSAVGAERRCHTGDGRGRGLGTAGRRGRLRDVRDTGLLSRHVRGGTKQELDQQRASRQCGVARRSGPLKAALPLLSPSNLALRQAVTLVVYAWTYRQLHKCAFLPYVCPVMDMATLLLYRCTFCFPTT